MFGQMATKNCLKISYQGLRYVICESNTKYEDIIKIAIDRFSIPIEYHNNLLITNNHGYIFDKQLLEYFILLFPQPQIQFYIQVDFGKIKKRSKPTPSTANKKDYRRAFGYSKLNNKRGREDDHEDDGEYVSTSSVPVHRQNCFLGSLPHQPDIEYSKKIKKQLLSMQTAKKPKLMSTVRRAMRL